MDRETVGAQFKWPFVQEFLGNFGTYVVELRPVKKENGTRQNRISKELLLAMFFGKFI